MQKRIINQIQRKKRQHHAFIQARSMALTLKKRRLPLELPPKQSIALTLKKRLPRKLAIVLTLKKRKAASKASYSADPEKKAASKAHYAKNPTAKSSPHKHTMPTTKKAGVHTEESSMHW